MSTREKVITFIVNFILSLAIGFYGAFVVMNMANWFISPVVHYTFTFWQTYGIMLIIELFTTKINKEGSDDEDDLPTVIATIIVKALVISAFFGIGALVNLGM